MEPGKRQLSESLARIGLPQTPAYINQANFCTLIKRFEVPWNWADNYGELVRGYILPACYGKL